MFTAANIYLYMLLVGAFFTVGNFALGFVSHLHSGGDGGDAGDIGDAGQGHDGGGVGHDGWDAGHDGGGVGHDGWDSGHDGWGAGHGHGDAAAPDAGHGGWDAGHDGWDAGHDGGGVSDPGHGSWDAGHGHGDAASTRADGSGDAWRGDIGSAETEHYITPIGAPSARELSGSRAFRRRPRSPLYRAIRLALALLPLRPAALVSFLAVTGGVGLIALRVSPPNPLTHIVALASGYALSMTLGVALPNRLRLAQNTSAPERGELIGLSAKVVSSIAAGGFGRISYVARDNSYSAPARHIDGKSVPQGATVAICEIRGAVFYVFTPPTMESTREPAQP